MQRLSFPSDWNRRAQLLDRYRVTELSLNSTQRGSVVIGMRDGEKVVVKAAIKGLHGTEENIFPSRSAGLENEACILSAISGLGPFAELIAYDTSRDTVISIFRHVEGVNGLSVPEHERMKAVRGLFKATTDLHELGYAHGDIQPFNVIIHPNHETTGHVTLVDFEMSSELSAGQLSYPGKREYLSPLSARDVMRYGKIVDAQKQDVYASALTSLAILAGHEIVFFEQKNISSEEKIMAIAAGKHLVRIPHFTHLVSEDARLLDILANIVLRIDCKKHPFPCPKPSICAFVT